MIIQSPSSLRVRVMASSVTALARRVSPGWAFFALAASSVAGCTAQVDPAAKDEQVSTTEEAITNGTVVTDDGYTGIVALQVFSTTINSYSTFCSATLMTNTKAITAAHCMDDSDLNGRQIYAKMGSQRVPVTASSLNVQNDVAVIKFSAPMMMWNWSNTAYLTSPRKLATTGFTRSAYSGTDASVTAILAFGYGGATSTNPQPVLKAALLPCDYGTDGLNPTNEIHAHRNSAGQLQYPGDSGGPGLAGTDPVGAPLAYVQSDCYYSSLQFCDGFGAQDWGGWAYLTLLAL